MRFAEANTEGKTALSISAALIVGELQRNNRPPGGACCCVWIMQLVLIPVAVMGFHTAMNRVP